MRLPPLNAIKSFEAAARCGSHVAAARELGVTPAAVSQQVRNLEAFFAKRLFERRNNRIVLSDAGRAIYGEMAAALTQMARVTERLLSEEVASRLVVSALPSLAAGWLNRELPAFARRRPQIAIDLRVEEDPVDFAQDGIDIRLCYGAYLYPDLDTRILCRDEVLPLASPGYLARFEDAPVTPARLPEMDLIHGSWGPGFASLPGWSDWRAAAGLETLDISAKGSRIGMSSVALDLAAAGMGLLLGQRLMAGAMLAEGRLVSPFGPALKLGHPYCAVLARGGIARDSAARFLAWLSDLAPSALRDA